jgi:UDP-N-acetylmuramoylalanine--D-glutamate ligase
MHIYKSALILGLAASGEAAARLLLAEGTKVQIVDENDNAGIRRRAEALEKLGAGVAIGATALPDRPCEACILSPGVKPSSPVLKEVLARGIPVLPEFELGWSRARCPVLAVTGSNGKSTLVKLCTEAMQLAGRSSFAAGNYGPPVSQVVLEHPGADWLIIEVSSFQLETVRNFHPQVGVLLNVFPNHLDRHHDLQTYAGIKARLFAKMQSADKAVINEDNLAEMTALFSCGPAVISFGLSRHADYCFRANAVESKTTGRKVNFSGTYFANDVLGMTAAAAAAAMDACGISPGFLESAARAFHSLPHRMELIGIRNKVRFVDDSKATNLAALIGALRMLPGKARLIAGGLPKNESYAPVLPLLAQKVAGVYLIGKAAPDMAAVWRDTLPCHHCETLESAVTAAWQAAQPGETILLSPACASFDQFRNFEERGARFRQIAELLDK